MSNSLGNVEIMAENIQYYLDKFNMKRKDLVEMIGVPYTTICSWLSADAYPRIDRIEKMAQVFGISKADLVERRDMNRSAINDIAFGDYEFALYGELSEADEDVKAEILKTVQRANELRKLKEAAKKEG